MLDVHICYSQDGYAVSDFECEWWLKTQVETAEATLGKHQAFPVLKLRVSTVNVLIVAQALKLEGTITGRLQMEYGDGEVYMFDSESGRPDAWPRTFPDYYHKWLERLL